MARAKPHAKDDLTSSWTPIDAGAESVELTSEEDVPQHTPSTSTSPTAVDLTASRNKSLQEALGNETGATTSKSAAKASPRKRMTSSTKRLDLSPVIMPRLEHTSSQDSGVPRAREPFVRRTRRESVSPVRSRRRLARAKVEPSESSGEVIWSRFVSPVLSYVLSIVGITFNLAKPLLGYGLAIYLLVGLLIMARNLVMRSVTTALTPVCLIPGASLMLPFCANVNSIPIPHGEPEFASLISTQAAFEDILSNSAESASLPMDMKRSEASIRDLRHVVEYSGLPSRNELVLEFNGFIETSRQASSDLTRYNSRIGRAVDRVVSTNRWTLRVLDSIAATEAATVGSGGVLGSVVSSLNVFAPFTGVAAPSAQEQLYEQYLHHTAEIEAQISALIVEAQALLAVLANLDDRLDVIASVAERDGVHIKGNKEDLLAALWTKLGGNRASMARVQRQLGVLREVGSYRSLAFAHVSATIVKLQGIAAALEDLRERVARPEVLGAKGQIPLDVHIGVILMGVERLEDVREAGRRKESARIRGVLDKGEALAIDGGGSAAPRLATAS